MHSALRQFYKTQKAIAAARHEDHINLLSPAGQLLQRAVDHQVADRWEGIKKANVDAILYGVGVYRDTLDGTEYVFLGELYDEETAAGVLP